MGLEAEVRRAEDGKRSAGNNRRSQRLLRRRRKKWFMWISDGPTDGLLDPESNRTVIRGKEQSGELELKEEDV